MNTETKTETVVYNTGGIPSAKLEARIAELVDKAVEEANKEIEIEIPDEVINAPKRIDEVEKSVVELLDQIDKIKQSVGHQNELDSIKDHFGKAIKSVCDRMDQMVRPKEIVIKHPAIKKTIKAKLIHRQFESVLRWCSARDANGYPIPVWLYGAPGAGKTHLFMQIAEALGVEFFPISFGPTTTDSKVIGFQNAAVGKYVSAVGRQWFERGGLLYCDEIDNAEPGALVALNAMIANSVMRFPDGKLIKKHKNCYVAGGANTLGTGATQGFRRQSQDAAARSRWAKVKLEYDPALEAALAPMAKWTQYVQAVRVETDKIGKSNLWVTPRDSILGAAALLNGVPAGEVVEHLFAEFSMDAREQVERAVGKFTL